ncbi:putative MFS family arabinose efflux permease [Thermasporomyces composti]|jgi:MFS family permease|uniref:Putative MFS family arabinose efflux permease n=1 Tax=Thermasporomyces composti TaxID=696763 RepID=A0A3D9VBR9_THECX|nr:putative MFS family arabinose efflux permease [Thermasporomyces composti]
MSVVVPGASWSSAWMSHVSGDAGGVARLRGSAAHRVYSVVVFLILASIDNVAAVLVPPLYAPIARDLAVPESALGLVTAATFLVAAIAAVGWAYVGDRTRRKPVLLVGTLVWAVGTAGTAVSDTYVAFFGAQLVAAIGLGAVASVGFSVVSDLISPKRRGLVMSFWGLSQGAGTLAGTLLAGLLGASDWRRPFVVLAIVGLVATVAYLLTYDIPRGRSEPELAAVFEHGGEYDHRISRSDLPDILRRRTNVWLVLQGVTAQFVFGSLVWLPRLFQAKAEQQGYPEETAIVVGSLFATLFQLGGITSILGGLVGDRLQRRTPRGRALVASIGILGGIPFYVVLFFLPLPIDIGEPDGLGAVVAAALTSLVTQPMVGLSFLAALLALALTSANSPNWFALLADVNPPEHRGTVYSLGNLANGVGRSVGNGVVGLVFRTLEKGGIPPPLNYAIGLAAFQLFFVPTGVMYWLASRTSPRDIESVRHTLRARATAATADGVPPTSGTTEGSTPDSDRRRAR